MATFESVFMPNYNVIIASAPIFARLNSLNTQTVS